MTLFARQDFGVERRLPTIAIVGSGPTCVYTLQGLVKSSVPLSITIFEANAEAGKGTPYYPAANDKAMLANIASIELPPVTETLVNWLHRQDDGFFAEYDIRRSQIGEREFYPRILIGEYLNDQFHRLLDIASGKGHTVEVRPSTRVVDIALRADGVELSAQKDGRDVDTMLFDKVVLATGHDWPKDTETSPGYFMSPWPASDLARIRSCPVGILGTSLSAIDAAVTLAASHGEFVSAENGRLAYEPRPGTEQFSMTMMSRKGILPEADFFCPIPYEQPTVCTEAAVDAAIAEGPSGLLDKCFDLFRSELIVADPDYSNRIGIDDATVKTIAKRYFGERAAADPFEWAKTNLEQSESDWKTGHVVGWRYAILRVHEVVARVVPHLDAADLERFHRYFKVVFVDDYATVPHQSIKRLLALWDAGKLSIEKLGKHYEITRDNQAPGVTVSCGGSKNVFEAFIDATGQHALSARELPFPSLRGTVKEAKTPIAGATDEQNCRMVRTGGIDIDEHYRPIVNDGICNKLYCVAIAFLLHKLPFVQGITSSRDLGAAVSATIISEIEASALPERALEVA